MCFDNYLLSLSLLLLAPAVFSCSVFENRSGCPCRLSLDVTDPANTVCDTLSVHLDNKYYNEVFHLPVSAGIYEKKIPCRGDLHIAAYSSKVEKYLHGDCLVIPEGEQCPEAYFCVVDCLIDGEEHTGHLRVDRNFCGVTLSFVTEYPADYNISVKGNVCGYDRNGGMMEGSFTYVPDFSRSSSAYFRLPRQKDSSLSLAISSPAGSVRYFSLGNYIEQSGYDWTKQDLEDISISIDYASTLLTLTINDWTKEIEIDVVI